MVALQEMTKSAKKKIFIVFPKETGDKYVRLSLASPTT
jgi:hypothetical protein